MHNSQEVANIIKNLAKSKKVTIGKMLSDCNLSVNTLSSMQSGGYYPRLEAIAKIADYLECSIDYLLGRTESDTVSKDVNLSLLTQEEKDILTAYRKKANMRDAVKKLLLDEEMPHEESYTIAALDGKHKVKKAPKKPIISP